MRQINDQQYSKFTPEERVQLTFAALARNDETEANRLWETCPLRTVEGPDINFAFRLNDLILLGAVFFEKFIRCYILMNRADAMVIGSESDLEFEEKDEALTEIANQTREIIELAKKARSVSEAEMKALYKGFEQFCTKAGGVNFKDVIKSTSIEEVCVDIEYILKRGDEAKEEDVKRCYEMFLSYWKY